MRVFLACRRRLVDHDIYGRRCNGASARHDVAGIQGQGRLAPSKTSAVGSTATPMVSPRGYTSMSCIFASGQGITTTLGASGCLRQNVNTRSLSSAPRVIFLWIA